MNKRFTEKVVCPGWTHSEIVDAALDAHPDVMGLIRQWVPMERVAETVEIARVVLWLCSEESFMSSGRRPETMKINHEETKKTKIFSVLSSSSSFLRG